MSKGQLDGFLEGAHYLVDVLLLSRTDAFVGKMTSNFDRLVHALQTGRSGCVRPYVSLDAPWCFDYMSGGRDLGIYGGHVVHKSGKIDRFAC